MVTFKKEQRSETAQGLSAPSATSRLPEGLRDDMSSARVCVRVGVSMTWIRYTLFRPKNAVIRPTVSPTSMSLRAGLKTGCGRRCTHTEHTKTLLLSSSSSNHVLWSIHVKQCARTHPLGYIVRIFTHKTTQTWIIQKMCVKLPWERKTTITPSSINHVRMGPVERKCTSSSWHAAHDNKTHTVKRKMQRWCRTLLPVRNAGY